MTVLFDVIMKIVLENVVAFTATAAAAAALLSIQPILYMNVCMDVWMYFSSLAITCKR